jgi:hypothetical protein
VAKVSPGVYRDLLIDRLSESIKLPAARLNQLWFNEATDPAGAHATISPEPARSGASARAPRSRDGGGNKGLVTRAVKLLVHFPGISGKITGAQLTQLEMTDDPGSRFLFELIDGLQQEPAPNTGVLLTRWRERAEVSRMTDLAQEELPGIDEAGAALDLAAAISTLALAPTLRRHQELLDKGELTDDERAELRELTIAMARSKGTASTSGAGTAGR